MQEGLLLPPHRIDPGHFPGALSNTVEFRRRAGRLAGNRQRIARGRLHAELAGNNANASVEIAKYLSFCVWILQKRSAVGAARLLPARIARARKHRQPRILWKLRFRRGKLAHHKHRSPLRFHAPRMQAIPAQPCLHFRLRRITCAFHPASIAHRAPPTHRG